MSVFLLLLVFFGCASAVYDTQPSGYGNNNAYEVQKIAQRSPKNKPTDYSAISYNNKKTGSYKLRRNKSETTQKHTKNDSDVGVQAKEDQRSSVTSNRTDKQDIVERLIPYYDVPRYTGEAIVIPILHNYARSIGGLNVNGNEMDTQSLEQMNILRQSSTGGVDIAKLSQESGQNYFDARKHLKTGVPAYMPFMDTPSYIGGGGYAGAPIYIPNFEFLTKNNYYTRLEQDTVGKRSEGTVKSVQTSGEESTRSSTSKQSRGQIDVLDLVSAEIAVRSSDEDNKGEAETLNRSGSDASNSYRHKN